MIKSRQIRSITGIWVTLILCSSVLFLGCNHSGPGRNEQVTRQTVPARLFPDYTGVTVPPNIAPLNFAIREEGGLFTARWEGSDGTVIEQSSRKGVFRIPAGKWSNLLQGSRGESVVVSIFRKDRDQWLAYPAFQIHVAEEEIDPYLVYRLIPPGYETWSNMGLYQRDMTTFREKPVIENINAEENCVNCHSFNWGNSDEILFHVRGSIGGTMIGKAGEIEKVDLKREETLSAGVYPSWHPAGDVIAFSTNRIEQYFHARPGRTIEVMDRQSDLILYHINSGEVTHVPGTADDRFMETYPAWSPDGRWLYFSRADADERTPFDSIRYDIYRIAFDPGTGSFSGEAEIVFDATRQGWSASFPRISPDGKYLLCTVHTYGTFPIWHREADLCMVDLSSGSWHLPEGINSNDTESFHSWSSNTRWVVVSSRRDDGRYTKPYISYLDRSGTFKKAFLIPRKNPRSYDLMMTSFNRPELITGPVPIPPRKWIRAVNKVE
jgi:hypothetical protein